MRFCTVVVASFFLLACAVMGQNPYATVTGRVVDPANATIVGAKVEIVNSETGAKYSVETNSEGIYTIPSLQPGIYRMEVSKPGFKALLKPDIVLHVQDVIAINFSLPLGSISETVTVTGGAPLVNTESAAVSTVIDRHFVENLPLNGRSFNTLLQLTPGVTIVPSTGGSPGQFSINGQRTNANSFQVDGVSVNFGTATLPLQQGAGGTQAFNAYGGTSSLVSIDALQEFRVETSSYAPEFGRTPGGQVIISTRSGTNQFHGTLFDYFRNDVLDANDWFANAAGKPRAPERQNDFGGVLGGHIIRDRTFFFLSYEGLRLRQPQSQVIQVPSLAWRASAIPAAAAILNAYPKPDPNASVSADGNASPFTGVWSNQITMDAGSVRIDHTINSRLSAFGRYNRSPSQTAFRLGSLSTNLFTEVNTTTVTTGANWLISSKMQDSLRFNYSRQTASSFAELDSLGGATPPPPTLLFAPTTSPKDSTVIFSPILPGDNVPFLFRGLNGGTTQTAQWNIVDDLSVTKGSHQLKLGIDYRRLPSDQSGTKSNANYIPLFASGASQFASSGTVAIAANAVTKPASFSFSSFSAYAQDAWKIGRRVSLTYGLRWELNPPPSVAEGTVLASWQNTNNLAQLTLAPAGTALWHTTYGNFAPRIGVAWQLTQKGDIVVRGGWGIFYDLGTGITPQLGSAFPNRAQVTFSNGTFPVPDTDPAFRNPSISLQPPYVGQIIDAISPDLELPYSYQWNVAVEKSLWGKQALSVTYVGQVGRRLLRAEGLLPPAPNFRQTTFVLTRNGDTSDYHALQIQFRRPLSQRLQALLNYTWSHSIDTNSSDQITSISSFALSVPNERASSSFDVRQNVTGAVTFDVPGLRRNVFLRALSENWSLDGVFQARTGFPLHIFTTAVPIPGQVATNTRPDLVPGVPIWIVDGNVPGGKRLNAAAFVIPTTPRQGTLGRNAFAGFGATQIDTSLGRKFVLTERLNLQFRADVFNVFNHPNFSNADPFGQLPAGPSFGRATQMLNRGLGPTGLNALYQIGGPRSIQLALKLAF